MIFGKVITYKDIDEAEKLVGKKVVYSNCFKSINDFQDCLGIAKDFGLLILNEVRDGSGLYYPFRLSDGTVFQFIREVIDDESHYEPYDLSDPKVRDSLRGRWIIYTKGDEYTTEEVVIFGFGKQGKDYWKVMTGSGEISATELFENYAFDDGKPCGRLKNGEVQ